jgi:hypothetical protein
VHENCFYFALDGLDEVCPIVAVFLFDDLDDIGLLSLLAEKSKKPFVRGIDN